MCKTSYTPYNLSHLLLKNLQTVPKQQQQNLQISCISLNFPKNSNSWEKKVELPVKRFFPPDQPSVLNSACCLRYGIFPLAFLGYLSCYDPSPLLHTYLIAEYGRLEKVLNFLATTKNISVINILVMLNLKYSSYWKQN